MVHDVESLFGWFRFGLAWLITVYFLSHNTIQSTSRALFILPAEQAQSSEFGVYCIHGQRNRTTSLCDGPTRVPDLSDSLVPVVPVPPLTMALVQRHYHRDKQNDDYICLTNLKGSSISQPSISYGYVPIGTVNPHRARPGRWVSRTRRVPRRRRQKARWRSVRTQPPPALPCVGLLHLAGSAPSRPAQLRRRGCPVERGAS